MKTKRKMKIKITQCYQCYKPFYVGAMEEQLIFLLFCNGKCLDDYVEDQKQGIKNITVSTKDQKGNIINLGDIKDIKLNDIKEPLQPNCIDCYGKGNDITLVMCRTCDLGVCATCRYCKNCKTVKLIKNGELEK